MAGHSSTIGLLAQLSTLYLHTDQAAPTEGASESTGWCPCMMGAWFGGWMGIFWMLLFALLIIVIVYVIASLVRSPSAAHATTPTTSAQEREIRALREELEALRQEIRRLNKEKEEKG
ncbi:MAG: hypothetical protein F7C07_00625 [Desulfurococcales archaeon]|nr:hypothetical protein [Desulfurococcales archaeon]